ncbi:protein of unassigned function [Methylobacterium oryzae CBMB20]|uniref:Protein of unassigned function n=1 Tax=Methylobacterium oryzae CBMB20 TaxID=693986 RepID=A0A089NWC7_9HYPH|nr:protein of unassigned function [Methylobacterium oryzae CBMB20]
MARRGAGDFRAATGQRVVGGRAFGTGGFHDFHRGPSRARLTGRRSLRAAGSVPGHASPELRGCRGLAADDPAPRQAGATQDSIAHDSIAAVMSYPGADVEFAARPRGVCLRRHRDFVRLCC